ncbi:MAG: malate synthase A [Gammaproteobacteria bacterium AqS3]|nr:malate synthase A [Gammaproteobacteria bacterium AqS3]
MTTALRLHGIELNERTRTVFTDDALQLLETLAGEFAAEVPELLQARDARQARIDAGELPDFLPETASIRQDDSWSVRPIPEDLLDRRVEITGPPERKMVINALNSGARVYMADFEDSMAPTWDNVAEGQVNLRDAVARQIDFVQEDTGKAYSLAEKTAVLICRVRGLHLPEKHVLHNGEPIPAGLLDFVVYLSNNHAELAARGSGPYFYIPKLQSHQEAAWWNRVIDRAEDLLGLERGTVRVTLLIETLPAVFEMDEILYHLRDHIVALNCGRWDYIFSYIKTLRAHPDRILPDRQSVTMDKPFLDAYSRLLIRTCHRRGALAMGGMAAFIPSRDPQENARVLDKVTADKQREAGNGHDGTWVAHPGLVTTAEQVFDRHLGASPNQLAVSRHNDAPVTAADLLAQPEGERTEAGMRSNIRVALQYLEAWLSGNGCVPVYGLMEDAATVEISRASVWQWIRHGLTLSDGVPVTVELFRRALAEECERVREEIGPERYDAGRFDEAAELFDTFSTSETLADFLTLEAYKKL